MTRLVLSEVALGDIADVTWGDTSVTKKSYVHSGECFQAYSASGPDGELPYYDYDRNGVVLSAIGANAGVTWLARGRWSCIKNTIRFFSRDESIADTRFLYWATRGPGVWPLRGSAQPFISQGDARAVRVQLPLIAEQRAIAVMLGTVDDKIESNRRIQILCEKLIRSYAFEFLNASAQKNGELQDYCSLVKDQVKTADLDEDDNYVGLEHMPRGSLILESWGTARGLGSNKTRFQKGDILFGKLRPYFKKVVVAPIDGICSTDILVFRAKQSRDVGLVAAIAASDPLIDYVSSASTGTRMPRTSWHDIAKWNVPILNDGERSRLSEKTTPLVKEMMQLTFENQKLIRLRDVLLPELLSGRISVNRLRESVSA
ncbi:MAG: restriction endonuclease subunit S [Bifidobacterium psychraerophilum]|uniref:restriction endonuclease subunit S n=1 Tax=Bifidobacterium psychraerophilum TaxID=218140 RepID=UPI0039E9B30A